MKNPIISILVPVYNVENYIERCARSIFEQSFSDFEVVFVDDASPDKSICLLQKTINEYPHLIDKIKIVKHDNNKGLSAARNTALNNSNGKYILHLDSDDYIDKEILQKLYYSAIKNNSDITICNVNFVYKNKIIKNTDAISEDKYEYLNQLLSRKVMFNMFAKLIKRDIIIQNNIFSIEGIGQAEDFLVYPRIVFFANKYNCINESLYYYNQINSNSFTNNINSKGIDDIIFAGRYLINFFQNQNLNSNYLINNLKFYNIYTLLYIAPYNKYHEIKNIYPENALFYNQKWDIYSKVLFFLIKLNNNFLLYFFLKIKKCLKVLYI